MSDAQLLLFRSEYDKYLSDYEELRKGDVALLMGLSQTGGEAFGEGHTPAAAAIFEEFCGVERKIRDRMEQLDERLIGSLSTVLDETQLAGLDRVKDTRKRARCLPLYVLLPGANIDMADLVRRFEKPAEDDAAIDELLAEYERKVTPLIMQLRKEIDEYAASQVWAMARCQYDEEGKQRDQTTPEAARLAREYLASNTAKLRRGASVQEQILRVNEETFSAIKDKLKMTDTYVFVQEFRRLAYPDAYPDQTDPIEVYETILKNEKFDDQSLELIRSMWSLYRESYNAKCRAMQEENVKWRIQLAETEIQTGYGDYLERMTKLRRQRIKLNRAILTQIGRDFDPILTADSKTLIQNQLGRIETFERLFPAVEE